jgi:hypothetical protein
MTISCGDNVQAAVWRKDASSDQDPQSVQTRFGVRARREHRRLQPFSRTCIALSYPKIVRRVRVKNDKPRVLDRVEGSSKVERSTK